MAAFCRDCGAQIRPAAVFCPQCGASATPQTGAAPQRRKRGLPKRTVVSIAAILALSTAVYLGWTYSSNSAKFATDALQDPKLLASDARNQIFIAGFAAGGSAEDLKKAVHAYCDAQTANLPELETCNIVVSNQPPQSLINDIPHMTSLPDAWDGVIKKLDSGNIKAVYLFDPDNDPGNDSRRDGHLFVDCKIFKILEFSNVADCFEDSPNKIRKWFRKKEEPSTSEANAAVTSVASGAAAMAADAAGYQTLYIIADANLRSRATATSSNLGKITRGTVLQGTPIKGEDGVSNWLRLADGSGYVSAVNTSQAAPPRLATILGERQFHPAYDLQLHASPSEQSPVIDTVPPGTLLVITGITDNGFAEAKGRRGGVGYFPASDYDFSR